MKSSTVIVALVLLAGCDDTGSGSDPELRDEGVDPGLVDGAAASDTATGDATRLLDQGQQADAQDGACQQGDHACVVEGEAGLRRCVDGRWVIDRCEEGDVCVSGRCVTDPDECVAGQRTCLDALRPAECEPGVGWRPTAPCDGDQLCADGFCGSRLCAAASETRSYLGCDYAAVDLPNAAWFEGSGTPDSPLGVVLANPGAAADIRVTVFDADGDVATLVGEVEIAPPFVVPGTPPVTVRTEVWDLDGEIVEQGFDRASDLSIPPGGDGRPLAAPPRPRRDHAPA